MGISLKDALEKAGMKASKRENERPKVEKAKQTETTKHQQMHDFCDACQRGMPDVEFYKHNNPCVDAQWLCLSCADKNSIPDDCRTTNQSEYSRRGIFRREYGPTKKFGPQGHGNRR